MIRRSPSLSTFFFFVLALASVFFATSTCRGDCALLLQTPMMIPRISMGSAMAAMTTPMLVPDSVTIGVVFGGEGKAAVVVLIAVVEVVVSVLDCTVIPATQLGALPGSGFGGSVPSAVTLTPIVVEAWRSLRLREHGHTPFGQGTPFRLETLHSGLPPSKTEQTPLR